MSVNTVGGLELLPSSADPVPLRAPDPERPLFFLHIPRTGGFTLKTMLEQFYGSRHSLLDLHKYDNTVIDPTDFEFIEGHVSFRKGRKMGGAPNLFTIVRDPVSRSVSVARHLRHRSTRERHDILKATNVKPETILDEVPDLANGQVKQLSDRLPSKDAGPENLDKAMAVLDWCSFGLTEDYHTSVTLMSERFGLRLPRFGVSNASAEHGDDDLRSPEFRALLHERNDLDRKLVDHSRALFAQRVTQYMDTLRAMSLDTAGVTGRLMSGRYRGWEELNRKTTDTEVNLRGWLLVNGRPPDAVLAEAGAGWVPLLSRQVSSDASWSTRTAVNLYAGMQGTVPLAPDAKELTVEAYDRIAGVKATKTVPIRRR
ncbi:MAG: sulfotransferase family 2 domain-containing protein [Acidimicrobiia bacterium]|nr:sulfotransferase family 2 domain-containing protein [Acidimicrobiia bacterium]